PSSIHVCFSTCTTSSHCCGVFAPNHLLYPYADTHDLHSFPTRRSSDLPSRGMPPAQPRHRRPCGTTAVQAPRYLQCPLRKGSLGDRKSTRLNSSHVKISYAVFCLKKKKKKV